MTLWIIMAKFGFWNHFGTNKNLKQLQQTSLYSTTLVNGNSQMYSAELFLKCVEKASFEVVEEIDQIGLCQTLLRCRKKN